MTILSKLVRVFFRTYTKVESINGLNQHQLDAMYRLMDTYYIDVERAKFETDMAKKNKVITIYDSKNDELVGFSSLYVFSLPKQSGSIQGVFSGDTIIDQRYWGGMALHITFITYLYWLKLRRPWQPMYWFLISKGYKTYLLMANNFLTHYPRFEEETPMELNTLKDSVYGKLYPQSWDSSAGIVRNNHGEYRLRGGIASPPHELVAKNPRVRFFVEHNRAWASGEELGCIAEVQYAVVIKFLIKKIKRFVQQLAWSWQKPVAEDRSTLSKPNP